MIVVGRNVYLDEAVWPDSKMFIAIPIVEIGSTPSKTKYGYTSLRQKTEKKGAKLGSTANNTEPVSTKFQNPVN